MQDAACANDQVDMSHLRTFVILSLLDDFGRRR